MSLSEKDLQNTINDMYINGVDCDFRISFYAAVFGEDAIINNEIQLPDDADASIEYVLSKLPYKGAEVLKMFYGFYDRQPVPKYVIMKKLKLQDEYSVSGIRIDTLSSINKSYLYSGILKYGLNQYKQIAGDFTKSEPGKIRYEADVLKFKDKTPYEDYPVSELIDVLKSGLLNYYKHYFIPSAFDKLSLGYNISTILELIMSAGDLYKNSELSIKDSEKLEIDKNILSEEEYFCVINFLKEHCASLSISRRIVENYFIINKLSVNNKSHKIVKRKTVEPVLALPEGTPIEAAINGAFLSRLQKAGISTIEQLQALTMEEWKIVTKMSISNLFKPIRQLQAYLVKNRPDSESLKHVNNVIADMRKELDARRKRFQ